MQKVEVNLGICTIYSILRYTSKVAFYVNIECDNNIMGGYLKNDK